MRRIASIVLLSGLWMLLFGEFDVLTFAVGLVVGLGATSLSRSVFGSDRRERTAQVSWKHPVSLARRVRSLIRLIWLYTYEMIACNLMMARDVLRPNPPIAPAIFALEVPDLGPAGTTLLANLITLTPGSLVLDYDERQETLYIHTIYAKDVESMKRDYRRFARQIFRLIGREPSKAVIEAS